MKTKVLKSSQVCTDYVRLLCDECGEVVIDSYVGGGDIVPTNSPTAKLICENRDCSAEYKWPDNLAWIKPVFKRS
jgi:hypothetical protein